MRDLKYTLVRSSRKTLAARITPEGTLEVRAPLRMPVREIEAFLESKRRWITEHLAKAQASLPVRKLTEEELRQLAQEALDWFPPAVRARAARMGVTVGRITIRNQHTRWGSCSSTGNLNFNCLLMLAPEWVRQYVIVHELCHRIEMNHSPAFWALVAAQIPNYSQATAWLKEHGSGLMALI